MKFATKDWADLRSKLQLHVNGINLFISSLSAGSLARIEGLLDDLVRDIKAGRKESTILSTYEGNDELALDELERELVGDGITKEDMGQCKEEIKDYLRRLVEENVDDIRPSDSLTIANDPDDNNSSKHNELASLESISANSHEVPPRSDLHASIIVKIMAAPVGDFSYLTLTERQVVVFMATKSEGDHCALGIPYPISAARVRARAIALMIAFDLETFDYQAYGRPGEPASQAQTLSMKM